jgi:hypothetical protein
MADASPVVLSFVEEDSWESKLIAVKGSGHFSHVDALRPDGKRWGARSDTIGGQPPGIRLRDADYAPFIRRTDFYVAATELQAVSFWAWWESQEGKPYDLLEILGFALNRDLMHLGWYICSYAGYASLASIELISPTPYLPGNKIDPVMLAQMLSCTKGVTWRDIITAA